VAHPRLTSGRDKHVFPGHRQRKTGDFSRWKLFDSLPQPTYNRILALIVATILLGTREVWTMKNESLKKEELEQFRKELLALRERLSGNVRYLTQAALNQNEEGLAGRAGSSIHPAELGSDNYEQEFTLSLVENEKEVLERVDAALKAIEEGTYGKCEMCGQRIPKIRLKAIPYATTCVKCAEESERQASRSE